MKVHLAFGGPPKAMALGLNDPTDRPSMLVSFVYLQLFFKHRGPFFIRDWVLDSGAYSAFKSGTEIDLADYTANCKNLLKVEPDLEAVFALDVIGDPVASLANCESMWANDVPAIPCFHKGEPEEILIEMAARYPKIALGGVAGFTAPKEKFKWAEQCFSRVWPKRIHGFGFGAEWQLMGLPWDSADATNWEIGPTRFGQWNSFGKMSVRGGTQNLRSEVNHFLRLERKASARWAKTMQQIPDYDCQKNHQ